VTYWIKGHTDNCLGLVAVVAAVALVAVVVLSCLLASIVENRNYIIKQALTQQGQKGTILYD
jgi:chorismate synthase